MAIYRYFPSKEALYDAIVDAGMGRPPRPTDPREGWRAERAQRAHAKRLMLCARPWLAELSFVAALRGGRSLSASKDTGEDKMTVVSLTPQAKLQANIMIASETSFICSLGC